MTNNNPLLQPKEIINNNIEIEQEDKDIYSSETINELEKKLTMTNKKKDDKEIKMENFFKSSETDYEKFNEKAWTKGNGYKIPGYPEFEANLEGLESGFYLIAGESNSGKSALMMNLIKAISFCKENKLYGVYYSLDDSKNEIIPRIIAMDQHIPISVASKPQRYVNMIEQCDNDNLEIYRQQLEKREIGLSNLKEAINKFKIEDTTKIKDQDDLRNHIIQVQTFVKSIDPNMNIVIAIDSVNDIKLNFNTTSDKQKSEFVATFVKDIAVELDIIVFGSSHLRKLNGNRRPTVDDLKEANTLLYEASVLWLVYNDVSKNKNAAKIYWNDNDIENNKGAIIEIDWAKNKKSSFKGRTFTKFKPYYSLTLECKKEEAKRYDQIIYQS